MNNSIFSRTSSIVFCLLLVIVQVYGQANVTSGSNDLAKRQLDQLFGNEGQQKLSTSLASSKECQYDIKQYCVKKGNKSPHNIEVLKCLDELDNAVNLISKECQNVIYKYKYNMTHNILFDDTATKLCQKDLKVMQECNDLVDDRGTGRLVTCLYDRLKDITEPSCRSFIQRFQTVVFSDWRLSEYFVEACLNDINQLKCGRLDDDNETLPHEQGAVIACLSKDAKALSSNCSKQINRLTEMQSNDYQLDRAFYYACRDDRERLCGMVVAGNGRVYRCLYNQVKNSLMSGPCRKEVYRRQKLVAGNVKVDAPFMRACQSEANEHKCVPEPGESNQQVTLVNMLLCLEERRKKGQTINKDCLSEMLIHRKMLMSDYTLSPEIISECGKEIISNCSKFTRPDPTQNIQERGGKMIHCLLGSARRYKMTEPACLNAINSLLRAVNPGSDIRSDPLLETTCQPVINAVCPRVPHGNGQIIVCLLKNLKSTRMTDECEDLLMDVAYFMQRDWRITPGFLQSCRENLKNICQLPSDWTMSSKMTDVQIGTYLGCLHQNREKLDQTCRNQLKELMRIRSQSVGLIPEIEDHCMNDLSNCKTNITKGQEIRCLQEKYHELEEDCKKAVKQYTSMMVIDPTLDYYLVKACEPLITSFCTKPDIDDESDILRCLFKYKDHRQMTVQCRSSFEFHQIMTLKNDVHLSQKFTKNCDAEIKEHCSQSKKKWETVECLATVALLDSLKSGNKLKPDCRNELKFELLQRSENIRMDPMLLQACQTDIRAYCSRVAPGNSQVKDCLKKNLAQLSQPCGTLLRKREKFQVAVPENDYNLVTNCNSMIQKYCNNEKKQNIITCLRREINKEQFPTNCRRVLYQRLMTLNSDYRLNRGLLENCMNDTFRHCGNLLSEYSVTDLTDESTKDVNVNGRVIACLRKKFAVNKLELQPKCATEVAEIIRNSKMDVKFDAQLFQKCQTIIENSCKNTNVEDCLKSMYEKKSIDDEECKKQIIRIVREGKADIDADQTLSIACRADLNKYCHDTPAGNTQQFQCLLKKKKSVSKECQTQLLAREQLWKQVPVAEKSEDAPQNILQLENNRHVIILAAAGILTVICTFYLCRIWIRSNRSRRYKHLN